jgi:acetylglutamate kinase
MYNINNLTIIKFGGSLIKKKQISNKILKEIAKISCTQQVILIHGGGYEVDTFLKKLSLKKTIIDGLRFTNLNVLKIVEMVLSGNINKYFVSELIKNDVNAVGISGKDGRSVICNYIDKKKFGYVGKPVKIDKKLINVLLNEKFIPVVSSIASDSNGNSVNVNADILASALAISFKANRLIFLTDVPGVIDKRGNTINDIKIKDINEMIRIGIITDGMIPKIESCAESIEKGVNEVWIINGLTGIKNMNGSVIRK